LGGKIFGHVGDTAESGVDITMGSMGRITDQLVAKRAENVLGGIAFVGVVSANSVDTFLEEITLTAGPTDSGSVGAGAAVSRVENTISAADLVHLAAIEWRTAAGAAI
jgi:hypothetical protein